MAVPNSNYASELIAATLEECSGEVFNGVYKSTPMLDWFNQNKAVVAGGRTVTSPILYAGNSQGKWFGKGEAFAVGEEDQITRSQFNWKDVVLPLLVYEQDEMQNNGEWQIVDLVKTKTEDAKMALADMLADALLATTWTDANKKIPALAVVIDTSTDLGNVDASEYGTVWQGHVVASGTFSVNLMEDSYNDCGLALKGAGYPNRLFGAQDMVQSYKNLVGDAAMVNMTAARGQNADLGVNDVYFRGVPMSIEPGMSAGSMYFLNSKLIKLVAHSRNANKWITKTEDVPQTPGAKVTSYWGRFSMRVRARSPLGKWTGITAVT